MNIHNNPDAFFQVKINGKKDLTIPALILFAVGIIGTFSAAMVAQFAARIMQVGKISQPDTTLSIGVPGIVNVIYPICRFGA